MEGRGQSCLVRGQFNEFEMGGEDPGDFPDVPAFSGDSCHELPAGMLREMIRRTVFAAATENPRYALTGILWELDGPKARLVATDGRRLAVMEGSATVQGDHDTKGQTHLRPSKAMHLLERTL